EIGIRMALGARKRYVLLQFLLEAALMASVGGAIGIVIGASIAGAVAHLTPLPTRVTPFLVTMSLSVAAGVGVIAGLAPSIRAANLEPVEALRSE
ncbi:MAG: ABC transporter permease, partial [Thermoplasmata archaeon]